jgi:hypothetical protein
MHTLPTVEDYLEVVAGKKSMPGSVRLSGMSTMFGLGFDPIINLARYDVQFLDSVTDATSVGQALSTRQAELALKILLKYQRQLTAKGIDVTPLETAPRYRHALRVIDQTKSMVLVDDTILVRFPYSEKLINSMRDGAKLSQGPIKWDRDRKVWTAAPTEFNVNWLVSYGEQNEFEIDPALKTRMQEILDCEKQDYKIELQRDVNGAIEIVNAPASLLQYLEKDLVQQDLLKLVNQSKRLGYTVSMAIEEQLIQEYGIEFYLNLTTYWRQLPLEQDKLKAVVDYARGVNSLPIYVYDPSAKGTFDFYASMFEPGEAVEVGNVKNFQQPGPEVKLVWTHRPLKVEWEIPILISYIGLLIGGDKNYMLQHSNKVFFYCADVMKTT